MGELFSFWVDYFRAKSIAVDERRTRRKRAGEISETYEHRRLYAKTVAAQPFARQSCPQRSNWRGNAKWIEKLMNESRQ
jgi:hypothetical protein